MQQHQHQTAPECTRLQMCTSRCTTLSQFTRPPKAPDHQNLFEEFHLEKNTRTFVHLHSCRLHPAASRTQLPASHLLRPPLSMSFDTRTIRWSAPEKLRLPQMVVVVHQGQWWQLDGGIVTGPARQDVLHPPPPPPPPFLLTLTLTFSSATPRPPRASAQKKLHTISPSLSLSHSLSLLLTLTPSLSLSLSLSWLLSSERLLLTSRLARLH